VRWAFQSLPQAFAVGFTWKLLYESGSRLCSRGVWFHNSTTVIEKQFTHVALGCLPFVSQHLLPDVQLLTAPTARRDVVLTDKA